MFHSKELVVIVLVQIVITILLSAAKPSAQILPSENVQQDLLWLDPHALH